MARKKWEYDYLEYKIDLRKMRKAEKDLKTEIKETLNLLGDQKWEVVNFYKEVSSTAGYEHAPAEIILQITVKREKEETFLS